MNRNSSCHLTLNDWSLIHKMTQTYDRCLLHSGQSRWNQYSLNNSTLIEFLNDEKQMYSSLIEFYKQIHEFAQLNITDQILLIQCNLTHVIHIHHVLKDDFIENPFIARHMSQWINSNFHQQMSQTRHRYNYFIKYPNILKLALIPLMFTINLSRLPLKHFSSKLVDENLILKHQHFYITLLWKYLHVIYDENKALKAIEMIIFQYLRYQLLMNEMEQIISLQQQQTNLDQLCLLTKSLLRFN